MATMAPCMSAIVASTISNSPSLRSAAIGTRRRRASSAAICQASLRIFPGRIAHDVRSAAFASRRTCSRGTTRPRCRCPRATAWRRLAEPIGSLPSAELPQRTTTDGQPVLLNAPVYCHRRGSARACAAAAVVLLIDRLRVTPVDGRDEHVVRLHPREHPRLARGRGLPMPCTISAVAQGRRLAMFPRDARARSSSCPICRPSACRTRSPSPRSSRGARR